MQKQNELKLSQLFDEWETIDNFYCGKYSGGLSPAVTERTHCYCAVTQDKFVFVTSDAKAKIGEIARNGVTLVMVEDNTYTEDKVSPLAFLFLGFYGLFVSRKETQEQYNIVLEWEDEKQLRQNCNFSFEGEGSFQAMNFACGELKKYVVLRERRS